MLNSTNLVKEDFNLGDKKYILKQVKPEMMNKVIQIYLYLRYTAVSPSLCHLLL